MADADPDNRPVIPETNGIQASYQGDNDMSTRHVPVVGWTADGAALVATRAGQLVRATELPDFFSLSGAVMPDKHPYA